MFPGMKLPPKAGLGEVSADPDMDLDIESIEDPVEETPAAPEVSITPEAVCYRDSQQTCGNCAYMGADGSCAALNIPVEAGDGCNLFQEGGL